MTAAATAILTTQPLGPLWPTLDPFLFCAHHDDAYPAGNGAFGPAAPLLAGRQMGSDFSRQDGWSMYHGQAVPGFPVHPHRGFETVTLVRQGLIDHSDSLGAAARFGGGDVQWITAGKGLQHSEMFPLLDASAPNPLELPAAQAGTRRMLYYFVGDGLRLGLHDVPGHAALEVDARQDWLLSNTGTQAVECLVLQGRPMAEPVAQYGPFVMNTQQEIMQAMQDYRRTQFGGWPWPASDPVHGPQARRFARYPGQDHEVLPPDATA